MAKKANTESIISFEYKGKKVNVKPFLGCTDILTFTQSVVDNVCSDEYGYMPELLDFCFQTAAIATCTDYELPEGLEERFELVYGGKENFMRLFRDAVRDGATKDTCIYSQINELELAVSQKVEHIANSNAIALQKNFEETLNAFNNVVDKLESLFGTMSADDIKTVLGALTENKLDENKIVEAVLNHKKK